MTERQHRRYTGRAPHRLCVQLRELRRAARLSLTQFQDEFGVPAVVLGAYERGDRTPPVSKLDAILACYGYQLQVVPIGTQYVRRPSDMVTDLRAIANQLETTDDMFRVSHTAA